MKPFHLILPQIHIIILLSDFFVIDLMMPFECSINKQSKKVQL